MKKTIIMLIAIMALTSGSVSCGTTIAPTLTSMQTSTPLSVPTSAPSPTSPPTPTVPPVSMPTTVPSIQPATAYQLPPITHNLLFVSESGLVRWNHATSQLEVLVGVEPWASYGGIKAFSVNADGQRIVLERRKTVPEYEVALLDLGTDQIVSLLLSERTGQFWGLAISPDGAWIAYISPGTLPSDTTGNKLHLASLQPRLAAGGYGYGVIYAMQTEAPRQRIEVGFCSEKRSQEAWRSCMGFLWSPDSRAIIWSDADAVWLAELGRDAQLLIPHTIGVSPVQGSSTVELRAWSPLGRYVLAGIGHFEGWNWGVIDTETGQAAELPDMLEVAYWGPHVNWMQDGRLFAVRPGDILAGTSPSGQIWRVETSSELALTLDKEFVIDVAPENYPTAPVQVTDNHLAFALLNASTANYAERGLYFVQLDSLTPYKVNGLPLAGRINDPAEGLAKVDFAVSIHWSPDGAGAVFQDEYQVARLYVPTDGGPLYDLRPAFGDWSCCFRWSK